MGFAKRNPPDEGVTEGHSSHLRQIISALGALVAGYLIGAHFLHTKVEAWRLEASKSNLKNPTSNSAPETAPQVTRRPRKENDMLGFSSSQWSKLLRYPGALHISVAECMPDLKVPVVNDIPLVGRLFQQKEVDLAGPAAFFGWDEKKTKEMQTALTDFGRELEKAERQGASLSYPDDGGILFDLSGCRKERNAVRRA